MPPPPRPVTRKDVSRFTNICVPLRAYWQHYREIFETSALRRELLSQTAHHFFYDLNMLLIEHMMLQICKITDDEFSRKSRNLTTNFFLANADFAKAPKDQKRLKTLVVNMHKFRLSLLPARNKSIGHLDLDASHRRRALGKASTKAWRKFWQDLREFLAILNRRYVNKNIAFDLFDVRGLSDADQLMKALKESAYFRAILADGGMTRRVDEIATASKYYDA